MKNLVRTAFVLIAYFSVGLLMGQAQQSELRARQNAQAFQQNATVLAFYDREGKQVGTAGEKGLYGQPVFSPDRTRVATTKNDLDAESADIFVVDVASGKTMRLTTSGNRENSRSPVWSPDGKYIAYVALRAGAEGMYRKASTGEGSEELLHKDPGFGLNLSDWSVDGRFLAFSKSDLTGGVLYTMPLDGQNKNRPVEVFRSETQIAMPRFSPDGRYLSYFVLNRTTGRGDLYVRPIDASSKEAASKISEGLLTPIVSWHRAGKELYYIGSDRAVMVAQVSTTPTFRLEKQQVLFRPPGAVPLMMAGISSDGDRFVTMPPPRGPQLQQITIYDREGKVVGKVGEPGVYGAPAFSPDRNRLAVTRNDISTGRTDFWIFDIASGKGTRLEIKEGPLTSGAMWSPDGRHILYTSVRGSYMGIYRRPWDGTGSEELLFRYTAGAGIQLTDVSDDGKFLTFSSGGVVLIVPLTGTDPLVREAVEFSREEFDVAIGRFSPDGRFMAYRSNEGDPERFQIFVRPFVASTGQAGEGKWQISKDFAAAMLHWRDDGKEFFFRAFNEPGTTDMRVMSVEISSSSTVKAGTPKMLFSIPGPLNGNLQNISRDGQRFVFAINVPAQ